MTRPAKSRQRRQSRQSHLSDVGLASLFVTGWLALSGTGCPSPKLPSPAVRRETLRLPPVDETPGVLADLGRAARRGSSTARWIRLRYLVDLFDYARFSKDRRSRSLLFDSLGMEQGGRGREVTHRVLEALIRSARKLEASEESKDGRARQAPQARALVELLRKDLDSPSTHRGLLAHARFLQRLEAGQAAGRLEPNASLRLYGWCAQAFRAAARAAAADRQQILDYCLYPLYRADPRRYFTKDGARLPQPRWTDFKERMEAMLARLARTDFGGRLAVLAPFLRRVEHRFFETKGRKLPPVLDPVSLELPRTKQGRSRTGAPVVMVDQTGLFAGSARANGFSKREVRPLLTRAYERDDSHHVTLVGSSELPWSTMFKAIKPITRTGFESVGVATATPVVVDAPPGSYWAVHERGREAGENRRAVLEVTELPVSLVVLAPWPEPREQSSDRVVPWTSGCATRWLTVRIKPESLQLSAREGRCLPPIPLDRSKESPLAHPPYERLRHQLRQLKRAFPAECGLMVVVSPSAPWGLVARTLSESRHDEQGALWPLQAFRMEAKPCRPGGDFAKVVNARASARVEISALSAKPPPRRAERLAGSLRSSAKRCYLRSLDRDPTGSFAYTLSTVPIHEPSSGDGSPGAILPRGPPRGVSSADSSDATVYSAADESHGPQDPELSRCLRRAFLSAMEKSRLVRLSVELRLESKEAQIKPPAGTVRKKKRGAEPHR